MMKYLAKLDTTDLTQYLAHIKLLEVGVLSNEEFQKFYRDLAVKYKFHPARAYITFKEGLIFADIPDLGLS